METQAGRERTSHRGRGGSRDSIRGRGSFRGSGQTRGKSVASEVSEDNVPDKEQKENVSNPVPNRERQSPPAGPKKKKNNKNKNKKKKALNTTIESNVDVDEDQDDKDQETVVEESDPVDVEGKKAGDLLMSLISKNVPNQGSEESEVKSHTPTHVPTLDPSLISKAEKVTSIPPCAPKVICVTTFKEAKCEETAKSDVFVRNMVFLLDPMNRIITDIPVRNGGDLLQIALKLSLLSKDWNLAHLLSLPAEVISDMSKSIIHKTRQMFALYCARNGFFAKNFVDFEYDFVQDHKEINVEAEIYLLRNVHELLSLFISESMEECRQAMELIYNLKTLVDKREIDVLEKEYDIAYMLRSAIAKLKFDLPVTKQDIIDCVKTSGEHDLCEFNYLATYHEEMLMYKEVLEILLLHVNKVSASTDQRQWASVCKIVPRVLSSLTSDEKDEIAVKYHDNPQTRVLSWNQLILAGYKANVTTAAESDGRDANRLMQSMTIPSIVYGFDSVDEMTTFIFFCWLISVKETTPKHTGFFMEMASILAHNASNEQKLNLIEALHSLPATAKKMMDIDSVDLSYLSIPKLIIENLDINALRSSGLQAISAYITKFSPSKLLKFVIIPMLADASHRSKAALSMTHVLSSPEFETELKSEESLVSLKDIFNIGLNMYNPPTNFATSPPARFSFIANVFSIVSKFLLSQDVPEKWIIDVREAFESKNLSKWQHVGIIYGCFYELRDSLCLYKFDFEDSFENLLQENFMELLLFWQGDVLDTSFNNFSCDVLKKFNNLHVCCAILNQYVNSKSSYSHARSLIFNVIDSFMYEEEVVEGEKKEDEEKKKEGGNEEDKQDDKENDEKEEVNKSCCLDILVSKEIPNGIRQKILKYALANGTPLEKKKAEEMLQYKKEKKVPEKKTSEEKPPSEEEKSPVEETSEEKPSEEKPPEEKPSEEEKSPEEETSKEVEPVDTSSIATQCSDNPSEESTCEATNEEKSDDKSSDVKSEKKSSEETSSKDNSSQPVIKPLQVDQGCQTAYSNEESDGLRAFIKRHKELKHGVTIMLNHIDERDTRFFFPKFYAEKRELEKKCECSIYYDKEKRELSIRSNNCDALKVAKKEVDNICQRILREVRGKSSRPPHRS